MLNCKLSRVRTELVLHGHDDLHLVETVQAQILHEVRRDLKLTEKGGVIRIGERANHSGNVRERARTCRTPYLLWVDLVVQFEDVDNAISDGLQG